MRWYYDSHNVDMGLPCVLSMPTKNTKENQIRPKNFLYEWKNNSTKTTKISKINQVRARRKSSK